MGTGADVLAGEANPNSPYRDRDSSNLEREQRDQKTLSVISPFDEQEEWAKISEIMATFGSGFVRESVFVDELEREFQTRLGEYPTSLSFVPISVD